LLASGLHDGSIDDALREYTRGRRIVGVMGGHALTRTDPAYADTARLAHGLARHGRTVATGGGPGAMEAANLGARLGGSEPEALDTALEAVATVPSFAPDVTPWARVALDAVAGLPDSGRSLGIPTWHYGHEPPNPFASVVAKYFRNAIREDVLLEVSRHGMVFLPGAAGTVQEVFQAACTNYYAAEDDVVPMVFVGEDFWRRALPAWPLLEVLAAGRTFAPALRLVATTEEALALLVEE
jgi:predicted Rossmann-fold nucleotide-binding protein